MSQNLILSKDVLDVGYNERSFKAVGNPTNGAQYVEILGTAGTAVSTTTLSNVAASATNVTVLAANTARKRLIIHNDSTSKVRLKFGATASSTSFTLALNAYETYESPPFNIYTGIIDGIWETATGSARVTEMS